MVFAGRCAGLSSSETVPLNLNAGAENKRHPMSSSSARTCCSGESEDNVRKAVKTQITILHNHGEQESNILDVEMNDHIGFHFR